MRPRKWWSKNHPDSDRCPVVMATPIGKVRCELTVEWPHEHPK